MRLSRLVLVAALAAVGSASTALAQSLETGTAADTLGLYARQTPWTAGHTRRTFVGQSGRHAFATVPANPGVSGYDPAFTGGGSMGYNSDNDKDE